MSRRIGRVQWVQTVPAQSFASAAAAISDTTIYVVDGQAFAVDTTPGSALLADGTVVDYDAWTDDSIILSSPLAVAVNDGDPVQVYPAREVKWAGVNFGPDDDWPDVVACTVPHEAKWFTKLADDTYDIGEQPQVEVEMEPQPHLVDMPNQPAIYSASQVPIVIDGPDGESARLDGDGLTFTADDPLVTDAIHDTVGPTDVALDSTYLWVLHSVLSVVRYYSLTSSSGSQFSVASGSVAIDSDDTFVYVATAAHLRKYTIATGLEVVTGGWPVSVTGAVDMCIDGTSSFVATATQIRKFALSNGAETTTGGWPVTAAVDTLDADSTNIYGADTSSLREFAISNGAETTTGGWPIALPTHTRHAVCVTSGSRIMVNDGSDALEYSSAAALVGTWPAATNPTRMAAGATKFAYTNGVVSFLSSYFGDTTEAASIDAASGAVRIHDLTVLGQSFLAGLLTAPEIDAEYTYSETIAGGSASLLGNLTVYGNTTLGDSTSDTVTIPGDLTVNGIVTMTVPYCELVATAATTGMTASTWTKINLATTVHADAAYFTVSASVITVVQAGVYDISGYAGTNSSTSGTKGVGIFKGGLTNSIVKNLATAGQYLATPVGQKVTLAAGETIQLAALSSVASDATIHSGTDISRLLIRKVA